MPCGMLALAARDAPTVEGGWSASLAQYSLLEMGDLFDSCPRQPIFARHTFGANLLRRDEGCAR